MEKQIQHFSHPHLLELTNSETLNISTPCSACKLQSSGWMYTCKPCNFTLHASCSLLPRMLKHQGHAHTLSLLPTPAYNLSYFRCEACGQHGHGFSYHCNQCCFDIHTVCAFKMHHISHQSHPCPLQLSFYPPYNTSCFTCDVCYEIGSNVWLYHCSKCNFDVHLNCDSSIATYANTSGEANIQFQPGNRSAGPSNLQYTNQRVQRNNHFHMQSQSQNKNGTAGRGTSSTTAAAKSFARGVVKGAAMGVVLGLVGYAGY